MSAFAANDATAATLCRLCHHARFATSRTAELPMPVLSPDSDTQIATLSNGVRVLTLHTPHLATAAVSVFVQSGSQNESARQSGISHVVEHMAFKGTAGRDCQQINLDAERLGAEVNAHTDKDHTAFHMRGMARHGPDFIRMLGDIVLHSTFPEAELERERQVILQELAEDDDDALSTAFRLFDKACYAEHPVARPVIGNRRNIQRFTRVELVDYVAQHYSGTNLIVGVAGDVDPQQVLRAAEAAFGGMPAGAVNTVAPVNFVGGLGAKRLAGVSQSHLVLGFPVPALGQDHHSALVAAALFGEGMSSPLLDQIRERRGLVYHAACSADVSALCGQMVIEASTSPEHVDAFFTEVTRLLTEHASSTDAVGLERARNQLIVRSLCQDEQPVRRLESAALELYALGRVRSRAEQIAQIEAVTAAQVRHAFAQMLGDGAAVALAGKFTKGTEDRVRTVLSGGGIRVG